MAGSSASDLNRGARVVRSGMPFAPTPEFTTVDTMITIGDVEKLAFDLPETQRAILAAHLLESLPSVLQDDDDGIGEALARDAALDQDPASGISLEQLDERVARRRP
jgi:hypothetical protein